MRIEKRLNARGIAHICVVDDIQGGTEDSVRPLVIRVLGREDTLRSLLKADPLTYYRKRLKEGAFKFLDAERGFAYTSQSERFIREAREGLKQYARQYAAELKEGASCEEERKAREMPRDEVQTRGFGEHVFDVVVEGVVVAHGGKAGQNNRDQEEQHGQAHDGAHGLKVVKLFGGQVGAREQDGLPVARFPQNEITQQRAGGQQRKLDKKGGLHRDGSKQPACQIAKGA